MAVYVDNERIPWRGRCWCHLVADSLEELHVFAATLGLKRTWFQSRASYPHYDVTTAVRDRALRLGTLQADKAMLIACCKKLRAELLASETHNTASLGRPNQGPAAWTESLFNSHR